jgi:hypothetical protein
MELLFRNKSLVVTSASSSVGASLLSMRSRVMLSAGSASPVFGGLLATRNRLELNITPSGDITPPTISLQITGTPQ